MTTPEERQHRRNEIAALRKDKARADWQEDHPDAVFYSWGYKKWYVAEKDSTKANQLYDTWRDAADAAMEAENETTSETPSPYSLKVRAS